MGGARGQGAGTRARDQSEGPGAGPGAAARRPLSYQHFVRGRNKIPPSVHRVFTGGTPRVEGGVAAETYILE